MANAAELAPRFHDLFAGMQRAYGTYDDIRPDQERSDGKLKGKGVTLRKQVTDTLWELHLKGKNGLGIIPIREDNSACFGAIDIDVYSGIDHAQIAHQLDKLGLPLVVCRSKSGGVHIYLFTSAPVPAARMVDRLRDIASKLGYGKAEIFPVQIRLGDDDKDLGAWINMPYFEWGNTTRYAIKPDGTKLSAEEFVNYAEESKVDADFFPEPEKANARKTRGTEKSEGEKVLPDGPPCLQHLIDNGIGEGGRNKVLFNIGIYYRKARPDFVTHIESANRKFFVPPLPSGEVNAITSSLNKKAYSYTCSDPELAPYCNAVKCRLRKYGVGGGASGFPTILGLRKLLVDPPVWFLDLEDPTTGEPRTLELTVEELDDPRLFRRKCMSYLDIAPVMPTTLIWQQTVANLISNVSHMEAPPPEAASAEGQFWELLEEFCTDRAQASRREELLIGMPYTEKGRTYFRTRDLVLFLNRRHFKEYKVQNITKVLRKRGDVSHVTWHLPSCTQLWSLPAYERHDEEFAVPDAVTKDEKEF